MTRPARVRAPQLNGRGGWLNTDRPLSLATLRGRFVLLDFWTFACLNCLHVIDELRPLEAKYARGDDGVLVVIGDVNPGAELVASGDIVVFGALRGVAHAGAQGDRGARVIALELNPTQLRIATAIAGGETSPKPRGPEHASIAGDRIVVVPFAAADLRKEQQA